MSKEKLNDAISRLKDALKEVGPDDTTSRERLKQLIITVEEKLNASQQEKEQPQLLKALEEKAVYFEGKHPVISRTLEEIVEMLTKLGM